MKIRSVALFAMVLICLGFASQQNQISRDMFFGKWSVSEFLIDGNSTPGKDSAQYWFRPDSTFSYAFNYKEKQDSSNVSGTWIYNSKDKRIEISYTSSSRLYMYFISYIDADSISMVNGYGYGKETEYHLKRVK